MLVHVLFQLSSCLGRKFVKLKLKGGTAICRGHSPLSLMFLLLLKGFFLDDRKDALFLFRGQHLVYFHFELRDLFGGHRRLSHLDTDWSLSSCSRPILSKHTALAWSTSLLGARIFNGFLSWVFLSLCCLTTNLRGCLWILGSFIFRSSWVGFCSYILSCLCQWKIV